MKKRELVIDILYLNIFLLIILIANEWFGFYDLGQFIKWYLVFLGSTIIGYPITRHIFRNFSDLGYIFAKVIGFLIPAIIFFALCNYKILKFSVLNCNIIFVIFLVMAAIYLITDLRKNKKDGKIVIPVDKIRKIYHMELVFFIFLVLITYVKGFSPAASDIEKFMDYGFMNSMANNNYLPANDMWLSGYAINYYYYGHYMATFISKVANVSVDYGYNFMLVSIFVMAFLASYSIVYNLFKIFFEKDKENKKRKRLFPVIGGIIAGLSNTIAGNGHFIIYRYIVPFVDKITGHVSEYQYGFPDSTRYIGENPNTPDKTIHEFPSYSFVVGDLHAHVSDIIYVLTTMAIALAYILNMRKKYQSKKKENFEIKDVISIYTIIFGLLVGVMKMTNYWDYPIYLVVVLITFLITNIISYKKINDAILCTLMQMLIVFTISTIVSLPFVLQFIKISSKIKLAPYHTKLYQFLVLWGIPLAVVILFMTWSIITFAKEFKLKEKVWYKKVWEAIYGYISKLTISDLFIVIMACCAIGLLIAPEIVYVVDIYDDAPRANTMFKLTYNSYMMFSLCFGYMLLRLIANKKLGYKIGGWILLGLFLWTCVYIYEPVGSWFGNLLDHSNYEGLSATEFLNSYAIGSYMDEGMSNYIDYSITMEDDLAMINWLKANAKPTDVILEYKGDDFTFDNRISTFTAMPTVLGWIGHEWLWRSVNSSVDFPEFLQERCDDIEYIYTSGDIDYNNYLIDKYDIKYIIVGYNERLHISPEDLVIPYEEDLKKLGEVVFETNINYMEYPAYIIKVGDDK